METENVKPQTADNDSLQVALNFTLADLQANRDGQFSPKQRTQFFQWRNSYLVFALSIGTLLAFYLPQNQPWWMIGFGLVNLYAAAQMLRNKVLPLTRDLRGQRVAVAQGPVQLDRNNGTYQVTFAGETWSVDKTTYVAFKNGDPYCLYYAPHSRTLLSAEWLREN